VAIGFIIMQIGNPDLDRVCSDVIVPALTASGLDAKRVDKHNSGGLLKSEIIHFIEQAEIIVADLTNERPNCYLEIGYVMGLDKFRNLILCARQDHNLESKDHQTGGPKIHFDLAGYDVLFWHPANLNEFRAELEKRIKRRQAILPKPDAVAPFDEEWTTQQRAIATGGLKKAGFIAYMEARFSLVGEKPSVGPRDLLNAAESAQVHAFGWPIGAVLTRGEAAPKPRADGIAAEIIDTTFCRSYDYWALRRNGDFYLLHSLFEDGRKPDGTVVYFDSRIVRVTETLLYCRRLYDRLEVSPSAWINIEIVHGGIAGRTLRAADPMRDMSIARKTAEDRVEARVQTSLEGIETELPSLVKAFVAPLFEMFDYFVLSDKVLSDIVDGFVARVKTRG
jgi:hypothetical protein